MGFLTDLVSDNGTQARLEAKAVKPLIEAKAEAARLEPLDPMIASMAAMWTDFDWSKSDAPTRAAAIAQAQAATIKSIVAAIRS